MGGGGGQRVISEAVHCDAFLDHLRRHERGETSYLEMSRGLAQRGIERWSVDCRAMTKTFYDSAGHAVLVEQIK